MKLTGQTHIGLVRQNNQDALDFGAVGDDLHYAVVCDGMGGANGGNIASRIAVDVLVSRIKENLQEGRPHGAVEHLLESAMAAANIGVYDKAQSDPSLSGMGTTVVAAVISGPHAYISHVGDSRLYHLRDGELRAVTRDHSVVQEMIESGQITEEEARSHPRRNYITRALGVSENEAGEFDELELQTGDRLLLCTDGLTNTVSHEHMRQILTDISSEDTAGQLIQAALDGGGTDNVTVLVVDVE